MSIFSRTRRRDLYELSFPLWKRWEFQSNFSAISSRGRARGAQALQIVGRTKTGAFLTNAQSRFASVVLDGVLGPPHLAWHIWRCPCFCVVPEATHKASRGPLKGAVSAQKPFKGPRQRWGSCWEERKRIAFPNGGSLICLEAYLFFYLHLAPLQYLIACNLPDFESQMRVSSNPSKALCLQNFYWNPLVFWKILSFLIFATSLIAKMSLNNLEDFWSLSHVQSFSHIDFFLPKFSWFFGDSHEFFEKGHKKLRLRNSLLSPVFLLLQAPMMYIKTLILFQNHIQISRFLLYFRCLQTTIVSPPGLSVSGET